MRVLVVADETSFYQPNFINDLIKDLKKKNFQIYGCYATKIDNKNNIEKYLISKFYRLYFYEIIFLSFKSILYLFLSYIFPYGFKNNFFSIKSVFKKNKINFFNIKRNINEEKYLNKIKEMKPDLIINSSSLIFSEEVIKIPSLACLNRHTSLLPSYRGLLPVMHAISNNEKAIGVTVHKMTPQIDGGEIYAQKEINISNNKKVLLIYEIAFSISSALIIEAINNLVNKKPPMPKLKEKSYFTFPTKMQWVNFRKNGGKFI